MPWTSALVRHQTLASARRTAPCSLGLAEAINQSAAGELDGARGENGGGIVYPVDVWLSLLISTHTDYRLT